MVRRCQTGRRFLLPETLPAKESAAVLIKLIFGPPYQQIIAAESVEAVLVRRQGIQGVG